MVFDTVPRLHHVHSTVVGSYKHIKEHDEEREIITDPKTTRILIFPTNSAFIGSYAYECKMPNIPLPFMELLTSHS